MLKQVFLVAALLCSGPIVGLSNAQPATEAAATPNKASDKPKSVNALIIEQLQSGNENEAALAVQTIEKLLAGMPRQRISNDWPMPWIAPLMQQKRYELVVRLATAMVCARPDNVPKVEFFQRAKVKALMADQKHEDALVAAKSLYNVSTLRSTAKSIDTLTTCFVNARGIQNPEIGRAFRVQQAAGAISLIDNTDNLLKTIKVDASIYAEPLERLVAKDCKTLLMRGSVLLLADEAVQARTCFEQARLMASAADWAVATEGIARAIRANDGAIVGANAFLRNERQSAGQ